MFRGIENVENLSPFFVDAVVVVNIIYVDG